MNTKPRARLLIVDDKPANLVALEAVLESPEREIVRASSGEQAIRLVEAGPERFAVILLDVQMPVMDGYETARRIKRLAHGKDVPIIFVTAVYKEDADVRRGYEAGAIDYFPKPVNPDLLNLKVQIYTDLWRLTRPEPEHERLLGALKEREAAERALDKVLETVSDGVVITDSSGRVTRTNEEARWIWGGSQARPLERSDFVGWWVDSGRSVGADEWALSRALATGRVHMSEPIAIHAFDGRTRILLESASPVLDDRGRAVGAVVIMKAISPAALQDPKWKAGRRARTQPSERRH